MADRPSKKSPVQAQGESRQELARFFTNLDQDVFGLRLPQEVAGALFSRYSRSSKTLRDVFRDEFFGNPDLSLDIPASPDDPAERDAALKKAREFYDRVLVGYGDDSVAQLGGAHIACENISNVAAKLIEDSRIGIAPLEKSTRYVRFDKKDDRSEYPIYREPTIMASPYAGEYWDVLESLFEAYARQMEPMLATIRKTLPIESVEFRHPKTGDPLSYAEAGSDQTLLGWVEKAYQATVRAHTCDILRGYLPAATKTNVGLFGIGQAFEHLLTKLYSHPLAEARHLAGAMHRELTALIPSFVKRAGASAFLSETFESLRAGARALDIPDAGPAGEAVTLVDYDPAAEEKILAALLYPHRTEPMATLRRKLRTMAADQRESLLEDAVRRRRHRRDKPGRAFENVTYTFDILADLGSYRDLHRHRILTQERQDFTTVHGYVTPSEIVEAGFKDEFDRAMGRADALYRKIMKTYPLEAQYVVPFAYKIRWYVTLNLREAVHIAELRTMPQGHPDYRRIVQQLWSKIEEVHPNLASIARFVDRNTYRLGRLQSEVRTEYKRSSLESSDTC